MYKGEKFKEYLQKKKISVLKAAEILGTTRATVYQYFDSNELSRKVVGRILQAFGAERQDIWPDVETINEPPSSYTNLPIKNKGGADRPKGIPMYNVQATATVAGLFEDDHDETPLFYLDMPGVQDCQFGVRISGDSMYPRFRNGDWIGCKEVTNKDLILYGEVYYIITTDYKTVKYVQPHPNREDWVLLIPHNEAIKPTPVPKSEIRKLFLVKINLQIL